MQPRSCHPGEPSSNRAGPSSPWIVWLGLVSVPVILGDLRAPRIYTNTSPARVRGSNFSLVFQPLDPGRTDVGVYPGVPEDLLFFLWGSHACLSGSQWSGLGPIRPRDLGSLAYCRAAKRFIFYLLVNAQENCNEHGVFCTAF